MKKFIMCLSFILACVLSISFFTSQNIGNKDFVRANSLNNEKMLIVVGMGEVEVMPDTIQINFGLKTRADSLVDGQLKMNENIDKVTQKIKEFDKDATVLISYSSSYPVSENGMLTYEFDCHLIVKSGMVESSNELIETIISAGATSVHHASYSLTNKEDSYVQALVNAKNNANKKVEAMYKDATFMGLKEESVYNYCDNSRGEKIKVCAKVKAFYQITDSTNQNTTTNTFKEETKTEEVSNISSDKQQNEENLPQSKQEQTQVVENKTNKASNEKNTNNSEDLKATSNNTVVTADNTIVRTDNLVNNEQSKIQTEEVA